MRKAAILAAALLAGASSVHATENEDLNQFLKAAHKDPRIQEWIFVAGSAYGWSNAELRRRHQPELYCHPENVIFTRDQYLQFMDTYVKDHRGVGRLRGKDWSMYLLLSLKGAFPCPDAKP